MRTLLMLSLFLIAAATFAGNASENPKLPFPLPAIYLHQPDAMLAERIPDVKPLAAFTQKIQDVCASYVRDTPARSAEVLDLVVAIKPGKKCRFWFVHTPPPVDASIDDALRQRLSKLEAPSVQNGPVSFSMHFLLWGATEKKAPSELNLPKEWHSAMGTNEAAVVVPDGILPRVWPDD